MRNIANVGAAALLAMTGMAGHAGAAGEFIWPVRGWITATSWYPNGAPHDGSADIAYGLWQPIGASRAGRVIEYINHPTYGCGNGLVLDHGAGYRTAYCHMVVAPAAKYWQWVGTNQLIGYEGSTGNSTGPHVHFGFARWGAHIYIPNIWIRKWVDRGGWIPGNYAGFASAPAVLFRARVTAGGLNVRTGPGTGYGIVGTLGYGSIVNVYATSSGWYKILYGGYYRWIAGWYTVRV